MRETIPLLLVPLKHPLVQQSELLEMPFLLETKVDLLKKIFLRQKSKQEGQQQYHHLQWIMKKHRDQVLLALPQE